MIGSKYPATKSLGIPLDTTLGSEFSDAITRGICGVAIIGERWLDTEWAVGRSCNLHFVGTAITSFPTGFYVSDELREVIGWAVSSKRARGAWAKIENSFSQGNVCRSEAQQKDGEGGPVQMSAEKMIGVLFVFLFALVSAVIVRLAEFRRRGRFRPE